MSRPRLEMSIQRNGELLQASDFSSTVFRPPRLTMFDFLSTRSAPYHRKGRKCFLT